MGRFIQIIVLKADSEMNFALEPSPGPSVDAGNL